MTNEEANKRRERINQKRSLFIDKVLTEDQKRVVRELGDLIYVAALERLIRKNPEKSIWIDKNYRAVDFEHYLSVQRSWLIDEEYLVGTRLGYKPSQREIIGDFVNFNNGLRFKLFYFFKYPERMNKIKTDKRETA